MSESTINLLELIADLTIVALSLWAGWLFWRNYRRTRASKAGILAGVFWFVAIFKALQLVFEAAGLETFEWMDTVLASEGLIILFVAINIIVASGHGQSSFKGHLIKKPEAATGENREKAA